ncbi:hypothetical protein DMB44_06455 [Thermoplasma sp. Kam2015]|uniref:pyridoxal phosphate-dependent aminotransferase n=1 Tax=Thermoplasma sp. Kam2015 TaxID=2094122 RepID=UPI000D997AD8|nr:pyridoxal phosphate-dependent aminotransferase [Thermoplasma sp. Kam2015]PYB67930.1 hypothetical protein DMB44_06455 [Thermoplasma sp. Kam2015]
MKAVEFRWLNFLDKYKSSAKHNLSNSGLPEPDLKEMGIDADYEEYLNDKTDHEAALRDAIAERYGVERDSVLITNGGTEAIFLASAFISIYSRRIIVPLPEYEPIFLVPESLEREVERVKLENITRAADERDSLSMSLPNNPTGKYSDIAEHINRVKDSYKYVYLDETFHDFIEDKNASIYDGSKNLIVSNTMTKFFGLSSLRVGWIVSHPENISGMRRLKDLTTINNAKFSLYLARKSLERWEKFRKRALDVVKRNAEIALKEISEFGLYDDHYEGAPFLFVGDGKLRSEELTKKAVTDYGILVAPGSYFGLDGYLRVCLTSYEIRNDIDAFRTFAERELKK